MSNCAERLRILEEREQKRREAVKKSKQRPEYKEMAKGYNKAYYQMKKARENSIGNKLISMILN